MQNQFNLSSQIPQPATPNDEMPEKAPAHFVLRKFLREDHVDSPECPCNPYVTSSDFTESGYLVVHNSVALVDPSSVELETSAAVASTPLCSPDE